MNKRKTLKLLKLLAKLGYDLEAITDFAFMLYNDKKISGEVFEQVIIALGGEIVNSSVEVKRITEEEALIDEEPHYWFILCNCESIYGV